MYSTKSEVINFRVTPEDNEKLERLSNGLSCNRTKALCFMIDYFSEMKTEEVLERKTLLEVQNLKKRLLKKKKELEKITSRKEILERMAK